MKYAVKKRENPVKIAVYAVALVTTLVYIGYRFAFTLPFELGALDIIFGLIVIAAETIEAIEFIVYFWNTLCMSKKSPQVPKVKNEDLPEVDVFIATINEDAKFLEKTLEACSKMKYPDPKKVHIYLCDDGNRSSLAGLARKYKIKHLTRTSHKGAKAGNYNHALGVTKSPYVAIFDADMQPTEDFLMRTMPFFVKYDNIGFVQTPQSFNNPDIFQARLNKNIPFEQDYFYHHIQLARNNVNSVILCGTNCVISRKALKDAGNFAEDSIAEDVATGMLIESIGYQGIAINEVLAHGEAIDDAAAFLRQRSRWGRGCIQTIKRYGVFRNRGLNFRQKLDYFVSINYWQFSVKRMLYLILPLLFSYFGIIAIKGDLQVFVPIFFTQYLIKRFVIDLLENRHKSSTWSKIYELIQAPLLIGPIIKETLGFGSTKFEVTPKGKKSEKTKVDYKMFFYHLVLLLLSIFGIVLAVYKSRFTGLQLYIIPLLWLSFNTLYLFVTFIFDLRKTRVYKEFVPNKAQKYGFKSYLGIFSKWEK